MPKQRIPIQVNQFVGGLNTEANPLSFPPNASVDEQNMEINRDGSRSRRVGFDVESFFQENTVPITAQSGVVGRGQFLWTNVGGDPEREFMVVQVGNYMAIHDVGTTPLSSSPVFTRTFDTSTYSTPFGFTVVDGVLVVATGEKQIYRYEFDGSAVTEEESSLLIRDLFGVEATADSVNLTDPLNIQVRPSTAVDEHIYNLRNQTFALPRVDDSNVTTLQDPISEFFNAGSTYPSNADSVIPFLSADSTATSDRVVERFYGSTMYRTAPNSSRAPSGYFIIDAMERGVSRLAQEAALKTMHSQLGYTIVDLPADTTPGGPSVLAQYSGRVWYGGFSGEIVDGDGRSPRMSSYVLFSRLVTDPSEINLCYQEADPTSNSDPDVVDTDGGFIKIDGAFNIKALIPVETSLFVLAENGVWRVVGVDENTFTATEYSVSRLSNEGCVSGNSAVVSKSRLTFWGETAIYAIERNQVGSWEVVDISENTLQTRYDEISVVDKENCVGYYDSDSNTIRWIYGAEIGDLEQSNEIVLNLRFSAFTKNLINLSGTNQGLVAVSGGERTQESIGVAVTADGQAVTVDGDPVTISTQVVGKDITTAYYLVITQFDDTAIKYSFGRYNRPDTKYDWSRLGNEVDSPAYIETGPVTGGDARLRKDVPYLSVYFKQQDLDDPTSLPSSCLLQTKWQWAPTIDTGKWTSPRQIYRPRRDTNSSGILATRNRIRGNGKSVAFRFDSEENSDLHLYGWEFNLEAVQEE